MPHVPPTDHRQKQDFLYVAIVCVCVIPFTLFAALGVSNLQRMLQPAGSLLFGATADGELMFLVPTIVFGTLAAFWIAWPLTKWIRRRLRMPDKAPLVVAGWAESISQSTNWRLAGGL